MIPLYPFFLGLLCTSGEEERIKYFTFPGSVEKMSPTIKSIAPQFSKIEIFHGINSILILKVSMASNVS